MSNHFQAHNQTKKLCTLSAGVDIITVQFQSICQSRVTGPPDRTKFRICHGSLSYLTKVLHVTHAEIMVNIVIFPLIGSESNEISPLSWPSSQGDEIKILSGMSHCHMGDELIEIVQYLQTSLHKSGLNVNLPSLSLYSHDRPRHW